MNLMDSHVPPDPESIRILIVDDDPVVLEIMKSFVATFGYPYLTAGNGREALDILDREEVNLLVTDIKMPEMDGIELLRQCRKRHPEIGVIVVTGLSGEYSYVDVINEGAIDFMTKPFDGQEFKAKLQRAVRELTLMQALEKLSICDPLTGLYNRRYFERKIMDEAHRAGRQDHPVFLASIDVDNFKVYNDTFGHQAGDNLLATLGNIMLSCARRGVDWAFRLGGDEFAMIITQADRDQSVTVCERLVTAFGEFDFSGATLSIGVAPFVYRKETPWKELVSAMIKAADEALYRAKEGGRNRIVCA